VIIGLSGYARSGKDEAAKVLVEEYGFERVAFADKLRDFLYALNPIVEIKRADVPVNVKTPQGIKRLMIDENTRSTIPVSVEVRVRDIIDQHGRDGYKETPYGTEIRGLLQRLGTEAGRQILWDSIWIDAALHDLDPEKNYVVTDVRFPNEAGAVRERGGVVWRISRVGVGPANNHASETSLDNYSFDKVLENNGSLEDYRQEVISTYNSFKE
jgi:hypothetical protein